VAAIEHAVALRPDQAMYQLYHGITLYEAAYQQARDQQARRDHKKPEDIQVDPAGLKLDTARDALVTAARLVPQLWRAHYYLGRVYRDLDDAKHAAVQFTSTIKMHPSYRFGYVALIELYRRWGYVEQALAVATLGATNVPAGEAVELWLEAGLIYDATHAEDKAIEAFGKAISDKPDDAIAKFQRGQIYLRRGDDANARRDLEEVARAADPRAGMVKQLAAQLLAQLASHKGVAASPRSTSWDCRHASTGMLCRPH